MVRYFLILLLTVVISMSGCKTTENVSPTNDVDYSETDYDFKKETIIEVEYE